MFKTTEIYEVGNQSSIGINIVAIEKMVDTKNPTKTITVIHMFGHSCIVEKDLTAHYRLPQNILLYRVREIKNFEELKNYGRSAKISDKHLFMYDPDGGRCNCRYPSYKCRISKLWRKNNTKHIATTEAEIVPEMLEHVQNTNNYIYKNYIREVGEDYDRKYTNIFFMPNDLKVGQAYFDAIFSCVKRRQINENYPKR